MEIQIIARSPYVFVSSKVPDNQKNNDGYYNNPKRN